MFEDEFPFPKVGYVIVPWRVNVAGLQEANGSKSSQKTGFSTWMSFVGFVSLSPINMVQWKITY